MYNKTLIKFVKEDNTTLYIGADYKWRLQKNGLDGFSNFDAKVTVTEDYNREGSTTENIRLNDKNRTIKICNIDVRNNQTNRKKLLEFFQYNKHYTIYVTHENVTKWIEGDLYRMQVNEPTDEDYLLKATLSLHFDSPYYKSVDDFGQNIASLVPNFGFPWMCNIEYGTAVGVFNFEKSVPLINRGENIAYPRIIINFDDEVIDPMVSINDGFIRILGTFDVDDHIVIDYNVNPPRITNNDVNILGQCDRASKFDEMYILIGENTISFDATDGSDNMAVYVYYNNLYTVI